MNRRIQSIGVASAVLLAWTVVVSLAAQTKTPITVAVAGRANGNVSVASSGAFVGLAWTGRTTDGVTDVYSATSRDGARSFGKPVRVNQVPGDATASGEQPPRIVMSPRVGTIPTIVVVWTAKSASGTRLVSARSNDDGQSFGPKSRFPAVMQVAIVDGSRRRSHQRATS